MDPTSVKHLILDRDGVLNEEAPHRGYVRSPAEWRWIPGALQALAMLAQAGIRVSVASNQSGVGRGIMTSGDLEMVHAHMLEAVSSAGGDIAAVFVCPHAPEEACHCRKPAPGLIETAIGQAGFDSAATLVVGDDVRDVDAARAAGVEVVLVSTGKGRAAAAALIGAPVPVYDDVLAVAQWLLARTGHAGENGR